MVSLFNSKLSAVYIGTHDVVRVSRTSSPQKCPSSRRWCHLFWDLSVGHQGRPTSAAVCSQWTHNYWQLLHRDAWCALKFTISSVNLNDNVWK